MVRIVDNQSQNNKIIVIAGRSGIGKSAFVDKVLSAELRNYMSIRVNICKTSDDTIENLYYLNAIYRTIANFASRDVFDKVHSPFLQGISSIKNLLSFGFDALLDKTVGEGNTFYEPLDDRSVLRKKDYIVSVLQKTEFIITIDNIQNIDTHSLEVLYDILNQIANTTFVFEYTTDGKKASNELLSFYNALKRANATVYLLEMKCLDYHEAKKLAPSNLDEKEIWDLYQRSNGNLVKIQLADSLTGCNDDPITLRLLNLSKDEHFLINLLYLNESPICYSDLCRMLIGNINAPPFSEQKLSECIYKLKTMKLVRFLNSGEICIYHDSIISHLEVEPISVSLYSAYGVLKEYYCWELAKSQNYVAIEHLFCLYLRFSDTELLTIFPQITELIKNYKYPHTAVKKLISFRKRIQQKGHLAPQLYLRLVTLLANLCIELGFWEEAISNIDLIYLPTNPYHRAMRASALALDFTNDESIQSIYLLIQSATSPREKLTIELCLLSAEMARQPRRESIKIARKMLDTPGYCDYFEYAFLLSNYAELVNNTEKSIILYKQAIDRFHRSGRDDLGANILVFLSMVYAYEGRIAEARVVLDKGKSLGGIKESYLLNNYTVLDILSGSVTADSVKQLSDALLITRDPYEKILILCNLLVCYVLLSEMERAKQTTLEIMSQRYERFRYEEFLHIVYQDLLYYFKSANIASEVKKYQELLKRLIDNSDPEAMFVPIAKMQLKNQSSPHLFYSQFPFRVDFLGSWNVEISSTLASF